MHDPMCHQLAELFLMDAGVRSTTKDGAKSKEFYDLAYQLGEQIQQTIEDFIDALEGEDMAEEARLDDIERARACNRER